MISAKDVSRFYSILELLGSPVRFADLNLREQCRRGVYFFFEQGEQRLQSGEGSRVVRVGTHALGEGSRSTVAQRLRQHRGTKNGGNHRGSIFRLLVGQALLSQRAEACSSWGLKGQGKEAAASLSLPKEAIKAAEQPIELFVSEYLSRMQVIVFPCDDAPGPGSLRGYVERNAIALLSETHRSGIDPPSDEWLGTHSNRPLVTGSGLWNQRHTTDQLDGDFLDRFSGLIEARP